MDVVNGGWMCVRFSLLCDCARCRGGMKLLPLLASNYGALHLLGPS